MNCHQLTTALLTRGRGKNGRLVTLEVKGKIIKVSTIDELDCETFDALSLDDISKFYLNDDDLI